MNKNLLSDYEAFRKWFNSRFSLSLNGKFVGIGRLANWHHFAYRLYKYFSGCFRYVPEIISFTTCGQKVKLYNR